MFVCSGAIRFEQKLKTLHTTISDGLFEAHQFCCVQKQKESCCGEFKCECFFSLLLESFRGFCYFKLVDSCSGRSDSAA